MLSPEQINIIENYYRYYRTFPLSGAVELHTGGINWIMPKKGDKGPAIAFDLKLNPKTAQREIDGFVSAIEWGAAPRLLIVTPDCEPENIVELLEANGFINLGGDEPGMLLYKDDFTPRFAAGGISCREVRSKEDFAVWIDIVNTALHGWEMIDSERYYTWAENGTYRFYLGELGGVPVSTAAAILNGDTASLEFVSTLEGYRHRHIASALCSVTIAGLFEQGARTVTLSGSPGAVRLYKGLGFSGYFNNIIMRYGQADV